MQNTDYHLLLLHGALGSETQLTEIRDHLSGTFRVHTLNFNGHGGKPISEPFSMRSFARNIRDFILNRNLGSVHVFGYSMGGYAALQLALIHPELIRSVITLGTKFDWSPESAQKEMKMLNPDVILDKVPRFADQLNKRHHPTDWRLVLEETARLMAALGNGQALKKKDLQTISVPTLIGIGSEDRMVTIAESKFASEALGNAHLKVIEGFPHPIEKIDFREMAEVIRGFISIG